MSRIVLLTVTTLLLVGGCTASSDSGSDDNASGSDGSSGSGTPGATKSPEVPTGPDCASTWKAGATLPKDYTTCLDDGARGEQETTKCQDGTALVAYSDIYYAVTGGPILKPDVAPMQDTEEYGAAYDACTGQ